MSPLPRLSSLLRNLFRKDRVERDLDSEVSAYLDQLVEEKISAGMAPEQARRAARIELGGPEQVKEQVRADRRRPGTRLALVREHCAAEAGRHTRASARRNGRYRPPPRTAISKRQCRQKRDRHPHG